MKLKRVNSLLLAAILAVNLYIIIAPLLPAFTSRTPVTPERQQALEHKAQLSPPSKSHSNMLIIPALGLEQAIHEGHDLRAAANGPWRLPHTSTPDRGSNTVIVGHRFTYTQPRGIFYHLDRLKAGDRIAVTWQGKQYRYRVKTTAVVPADRTRVEAPTAEPQLTLYTCTPLWWPKDRLVVTATLEGVAS